MKIFITCFFMVLSTFGFSQNVKFNFGGQITNYETGRKESGVTISVVANGSTVATSKTASNGKYILNFDLKAKSKYDIVFSKDGFVTKRVSFDLTQLNTEKIKDGEKLSPIQDLSMEIFTVKPGIDFSFLDKEPVASFSADGNSSNLKYDISANQRMKQKIENLLDQSGNAVDDTDVKYNAAMQEGEKLFKENKLEDALKQFEAAAFLKPKEFQPQKRIAEIDALLRAKKEESYAVSETDQQYNNYIKAADNFRDNKQYTEAISKYRAAMRVKNEQYPKDEVAKIEKIVNEAAAIERNAREFQAAVEAGDLALSEKKYDVAVTEYNKAIALNGDDNYPKDQLAIAQEKLKEIEDAKKQQEKYDLTMTEANSLFDASKFEEAKAKYGEASAILPSETLPKDKIKLCDERLAQLAEEKKKEAENQAKQAKYDLAMKEASDLFTGEKYEDAKAKYQNALTILPNETLPKDQIKLCEERLAELADAKKKEAENLENKAKYDAAMKEATNLFGGSKFEEAKVKYEKALSFLPDENLPKEQIKLCDEQLTQLASAKEKENQINTLFEEGQVLIDDKEFISAKVKYQKILELDPKKNLAIVKLDEIERLIKDAEDTKNAAERFAKYEKAGDDAVLAEDFALAKQNYGAALEVKDDATVKDKFNAVVAKLANKEAKVLVAQKYETIMAEAKALLDADELEKARMKYQNAASIDDTKSEPKERMDEIDARMKKLSSQDKKYRELIEKGDALVVSRDYLDAIKQFNKASEMKPAEQEPIDKAANAERLSRESADEENGLFEKMISAAESKIDAADYEKAKDLANRAINLRPAEKRPEDGRPEEMLTRIANLEKTAKEYNALITSAEKEAENKEYYKAIASYKKAAILRPNETVPPKRISELTDLLNVSENAVEKERKYQENFSKGISAMEIKSYELALENFKKAQAFKPDDQVVQDKISEVQQLLDDQKNAVANKAATKLKVENLVKEANILFDKRDWSQAKIKYKEVVALDAGQPFSVARIAECDAQLQLEKDKVSEAKYRELVASADNNFEKKDFGRSKELFEKAKAIKPTDPYPIERLEVIDRLMNPTIIETSLLEPLGDVYIGENADLELSKAEIQRKNKDVNDFLNRKQTTLDQMEDKASELQTKTYQAQADLNLIEAETAKYDFQADENRQAAVEQVKDIQGKASEAYQKNIAYENAQNLADQEKLNYIQVDFDEQKEKANYNIQLKSNQMKQQRTDLMLSDSERSMAYSEASIDKGKQMRQIQIEAQESMNDDASRRLTEIQLKEAKTNADEASVELAKASQAKVEHNEDRLKEIVINNESLQGKFDENRQNVNQEIRAVQLGNIERVVIETEKQSMENREIKGLIDDLVQIKEQKDAENRERLQVDQNTLNMLKSGAEQNINDRATIDKDKAVHVQSNIDYIIIENSKKDAASAKHQAENASILNDSRNESAKIQAEMIKNKQEKTYDSQAALNKVKVANEEYTTESTEKQMKNAAAVDDIYTLKAVKSEQLAQRAKENQQEFKDKIDAVETAPKKETIQNALGMDFPEGVTEETFTRSGADGTIHTVITRRVVVIDGHGDVYVKTRRSGVLTYTKNNDPITEYTWQKETQNGNLVRH